MSTAEKNPKTGKNVRVAVRIRPMNDNEIAEKARNAVAANVRKRTVGIVDRGINREFGPFDKVYGPHAKQLDIYCDLVEPLVRNVLAGYNCTLFAYGQTSTGKTFTMEGEQINSDRELAWNEDSLVGVIPRSLQHIFTELEKQDAEEFSVRVSYVELYNEELYDLLSNTEMGHARLRLFEDSLRKGSVIISGLEEVPVVDRLKVSELLKKGAERRRTAATQMNLNSSRSHTVFTITVVIRENTVSGEELIKQGKLSLIDLAGSENISRSGSIDKRAREAGNINQSLLTLGRVIMALTSGAGHVPYRESKLTRILQDSLGGKTITTIVATLSPASTNIEETISTMEYASTAKNIKNQPEINQKLTHRALLKAYNDEMNRLMHDLQAARDKTGFFVDRQNYEDMNAQLAQQSQQIEALTDELQSVFERIRLHVQDAQFMDHQYGRLYERYKHMEEKYKNRCDENAQLNLELAECKSNLENYRSVLAMVQESANHCQAENQQLREKCTQMATKLDKTFDKIDVFRSAAEKNEKSYVQCATMHAMNTDKLKKGIEGWRDLYRNELMDLAEFCKKTKLEADEDMCAFQNSLKSLHNLLNDLFLSSQVDVDHSIFSFIKAVNEFTTEAGKLHSKLYEQHKEFSNVVLKHVENYDHIENFNAVHRKYADNMMSSVSDLKLKINNILEQYCEETSAATSEANSQIKQLEHKQHTESEKLIKYENDHAKEADIINADVRNLIDDFSTKTSVQNQHNTETYKAMMDIYENFRVQTELLFTKFTGTLSTSNSAAQTLLNNDTSSSLVKEVDVTHNEVKKFVENDIIRPPSTGETPKRSRQAELPEPLEIPDANELLNKGKNVEEPRRLSHYRPRDSILENPFNVLSPGALKETLKSDLVVISETTEHSSETDDGIMKNSDLAVNVSKRRRAVQNRIL